MATLTGRTLSHYQVLEEINRGGMGIVYRAVDVRLHREVALKVLPPELVAHPQRRHRFLQEARAAAALVDARIAVVHEVDEAEGVTFMAMELIRGDRLASMLARGPLPADRALDLAIEVAEGLARAHAKGIVHRDLKPGNILLTEDGHAKIIDFGIAKLMEPLSDVDQEADTSASLDTETGVVHGTVFYMSPEQARGRPVDGRTDIFSFGVVLQEMLTGAQPFRGASQFETLQAIVEGTAPSVSSKIGGTDWSQVQRILDKCLAKKPEDRYQDVPDLLVDLRAAREGLRLGTSSIPRSRALRGQMRRAARWGGWIAVGGALVLLVGMAARRSRAWLAVGEAPMKSVVALPCRVHAEPTDDFLSDAIPSTISTYLSQIEGLETKLPPTSVDMERIGGDLGKVAQVYEVNAFVLSSVAVQADHFALTVQLVEPRSRRLLWSREYEGTRSSYLHLVREAAEGVREAVRPAASPVATPAAHSEAELVLQRGRYHLSRYGALYRTEDADQALAAFQRVLELDPKRAEAAASAAVLFARKAHVGHPGAVAELEAWARRALQLDPHSSQAWGALSFAEQRRAGGSHRTAFEFALKAATFGSRDALAQVSLGGMLMDSSCSLALAAYDEASQRDPMYFNAPINAAVMLDLLGRREESLLLIEKVLRLEPDAPVALLNKAKWLSAPRDAVQRLEILKRLEAMTAQGRVNPEWLAAVQDMVAVERGDPAALERVRKAATGESRFPAWHMFALSSTLVLARHRQSADALEVLTRLDAAGFTAPYDMLARNADLAPLKGDARFTSALERSRSRLKATLDALEGARLRGELPRYLEKPLGELRTSGAQVELERPAVDPVRLRQRPKVAGSAGKDVFVRQPAVPRLAPPCAPGVLDQQGALGGMTS